MPIRQFVHTADWQLGKPFSGIEDPEKRAAVKKARIDVIGRIGEVVKKEKAAFVVVAGDLFDSNTPDRATVAAACSAIGALEVPVYVIPGNHDNGQPGCVWSQSFYREQRSQLAPNLHILLESTPVEVDGAMLYPCPLLRRSQTEDPTAWLRDGEIFADAPADKPRIVLAHGSTQNFSGTQDDEDELGPSMSNLIDLDRLPMSEIDYVALGDWHGTKEIRDKAWFSGTPENDRFQKGESNQPGHVLVVGVTHGDLPAVEVVRTAGLTWSELDYDFADDASVTDFNTRLTEIIGSRAGEDLLKLSLSGSLGIEASTRVERLIDGLDARLLRLKLEDRVVIAPTNEEIIALTEQSDNPLIAGVATQLVELTKSSNDDQAATAGIALRELHAASQMEVNA